MRAFRFQFFLDNNIVSVSVDLQGASASRGGGAEGASSNIEFAIASVVNSVRLVASRRDISNLQWSARATRRADRWSGVFGGREICGCMKTSDYAVYKSLSGGKGEGGAGGRVSLFPVTFARFIYSGKLIYGLMLSWFIQRGAAWRRTTSRGLPS